MQRTLQAAADGAEQRQPGDGVDQGDRQRAEQQADGAAEQPGQQVETAGGHRAHIAPLRIGMHVRPHADSGGDRGDAHREAAERRQQ